MERAHKNHDFPKVFQIAADLVGMPMLLQQLSVVLPAVSGNFIGENIYSHLARWPVAVYLTTNFDNEILRHLSTVGESTFMDSSNSPDHLAKLLPDTSGLVVHLHGDLRSEAGLVLTSGQYQQILEAPQWEYWRTKMAAVFQMNRVIAIGHSLTDPHIRHVLEAAQRGSGVNRPVCWVAPDVPGNVAREYLEKYRIRVVSYDNRDGTHRNLMKLTEALSDFVPPRLTVRLSAAIKKTTSSQLGQNAAAPGFFVFNKLAAQRGFEEKRSDVSVAALHGAIPPLRSLPPFSIQQALESPIPLELAARVGAKAKAEGVLVDDGDLYRVSADAEDRIKSERDGFEHLRDRFQLSLRNRLRRDFPNLNDNQVDELVADVDAALAGFFREGGLTLASTLAATGSGIDRPTIPSSIIGFMNQASAKYDDSLRRQAFSTVSLGCFIHSEAAEREYLGRTSQGFFGFHLLGIFGDAASERLKHAKETIWLLDSSAQIPELLREASHSTEGARRPDAPAQTCGLNLSRIRALRTGPCAQKDKADTGDIQSVAWASDGYAIVRAPSPMNLALQPATDSI